MCKPFKQTIKGITYVRSVQPVETGCKGCALQVTAETQKTKTSAEERSAICVQLDCMTDTLDFIFTKESP